MAKSKKTQVKSTPKQNPLLHSIFKTVNTKEFLYFASTLLIVFLIYAFSLFRPWLPFDERLIYKENFFPIPAKFNEISEIINTFISQAHMLSMNTFFSNHANLRCNPIASIMTVFLSFFFKKVPFPYHLVQLSIHLINAGLIYTIFQKSANILTSKKTYVLLLPSLFTLLWALHSANTEAVLLVTNWTIIFTYTFCFLFILHTVSKIEQADLKTTKTEFTLLSIGFLILMALTEYGYSLPLIIFFIALAFTFRQLQSLKKSILVTFKLCLPYFIGLGLFLFFSIFQEDSTINNLFSHQSKVNSEYEASPAYIFIERNLWFTPQIFVHFIKLLFLPISLSTYQSNLVQLSEGLLTPYAIFASLFYLSILISPIVLFFILKRREHAFVYMLFYAFFFTALPFLHIVAPTYCLSADRYCYFPSFVLLFIIFQIVYLLINKLTKPKPLIITLILLTSLMSIRTLVRIHEWNNSYRLYQSAANVEKNPLYKAQRLIILADYVGAQGNQPLMEGLLKQGLKLLDGFLKETKAKLEKNPQEPITLKLYGLDYNSLLSKGAYLASYVRKDNFQETPESVLKFFEPYIKDDLSIANINQISFYAEVLLDANKTDKAKEILEYGYEKYDYSEDIALKLVDIYLNQEKDLDKSYKILQHAYKYYPNSSKVLYKLLTYYEAKKDLNKQAEISYLIGLREHSSGAYQKSAQIYLDTNQLKLAHKSLKKLAQLKNEEPLTFLLASRYLDLTGKRSQILPVLNSALLASHKLGDKQDVNITKSILISLIKVNASQGNLDNALHFVKVFEGIKGLTRADRTQIASAKRQLQEIKQLQRIKSAQK